NLAARLQRGAPAQFARRSDAGGVRSTTNERGLPRLRRSGPRPHPRRGGNSITPTMRTDIIPGPKLGSTSHQLTSAERYTIACLRRKHYSQAEIARVLGRNRSTISRELRRNRRDDGHYR